ncbi:MAG TPA: hypothetical protein VK164_10645 [Flavobacterium sp.]|uniref:hypothetical protein n=1 Tax=Flavobacterium sp. TaxID=239 RepID=UPI002B4AE3D6|nr:hypothetical protein [Flavobacterium sp.]HLO74384.1 hypothetical protein [Flavobacterium sp.]
MDLNKTHIFSKNILYLLIAILLTYVIFPTFFITGLYPISTDNYFWNSLDPSWSLALKYSGNLNLIWGKDVAFTYGPLSYLIIKNGWGASRWSLLFFDIFYYLNFTIIFYLSLRNYVNKIAVTLIVVLLTAIIPAYPNGGAALVLLLFLAFWIYRNLKAIQNINYAFQIAIIIFLFYIKFNTGLISFVLFYTGIIYLLIFKKEQIKRALFFSILPLIIIYLLSYQLNVSLKEYIISGYHIVSGYNDIMYLNDPSRNYLLFCALAFILLTIFFLLFQFFPFKKEFFFENLFKLGIFAICIFIIYKQAFVRADIQHILDFFKYSLLLIICIPDFTNYKLKSIQTVILFGLIAVVLFVGFKENEISFDKYFSKLNKEKYFKTFVNFDEESKSKLIPNNNALPIEILNKIGKNTVDVFPWNIHLLLENNLNYLPRPVLQSYSCYDKYLQDLNFNHYNSENAPKFVLLDYEAIDLRYPFYDEVKTNVVLIKNYKVSDTLLHNQRKMLLLERKENVKPIKFIKIDEYAMILNDAIVVKKDVFYEIEAYSSLKGKFSSIIRYAPEINLEIHTKTSIFQGRTSLSMLKAGIFSPYYIKDIEDFRKLIKQENLPKDKMINAFYLKAFDTDNFKDKIKITEYKITQ